MLDFLRQLKLKLKELIVSKEAEDQSYLRFIFDEDPNFMRYQYSLATLKQSVYNNIVLRYRDYERVSTLLMLTIGVNRILDVGCGYGDLSLELSNKGKDVVLLDVDPRRLRVAKHRIKNFDLGAEIVCGDAHHLPFLDDSFDASFSNQVVEHVADPIAVLLEKLRVSKLKAIIICGNNYHLPGSRFTYYRLLTRKEPETVPDIGGYDEIYYLNHQVPPLNSMIAILPMRIVARIPMLSRFFAGNVANVYHKRRHNKRKERTLISAR